MSNYSDIFMECPNCGERAESDAVDVGVGYVIRGNYHCDACGWEIDSDNDFGFIDCEDVPFAPPEAYLQ